MEIISGVYQIKSLIDGKVYIGSSQNVYKRLDAHRRLLVRNAHHNKHLQGAWNLYGENNFEFEILKEVPVDCLLDCEQSFIYKFKAHDDKHGYNFNEFADSPTRGKSPSAETLKKLSTSHLGIKNTNEQKQKISKALTGRKYSKEHVDKIRLANIGKKASQETREKMRQSALRMDRSNINPETRYKYGSGVRGKRRSAESVARSARSRSGRYIFTSPSGEVFDVVGQAKFCREHGLSQAGMSGVVVGRYKQYHGWTCQKVTA